MTRERIGVVGAGVSGLTAAYLLSKRHDVVLFESEDRLGGHAHTHSLVAEGGRAVHVDSGFIVHNERTYPFLSRLFAELGVPTQTAEMSLSVRCPECGLEFAGARRAAGLFPAGRNLANARYLRMLGQIPRFHREANRMLDEKHDGDRTTLDEFLQRGQYSAYFVDHFVLPLISAVWSAGPELSRRYPARYLFRFLRNHGLLAVRNSPKWRTVVGGSRRYVDQIGACLAAVRLATPVRSVHPDADGVGVRDQVDRMHRLDRVVVATHADQALGLLAEPTTEQRRVLGAFAYSDNEALLHTDSSPLPTRAGARACWNYVKTGCRSGGSAVRVSYDMNRLMRLVEPENYVVTLNAPEFVQPERVLAKMRYRHPVYTPESVGAQDDLPNIGDERVRFAGAYHGWGFHEDGCRSGVRAAAAFGASW